MLKRNNDNLYNSKFMYRVPLHLFHKFFSFLAASRSLSVSRNDINHLILEQIELLISPRDMRQRNRSYCGNSIRKITYFRNKEKKPPFFSFDLCIASSKRLLKSFCKRHSVFCSSRKFCISFCRSSLFCFSCSNNVSY